MHSNPRFIIHSFQMFFCKSLQNCRKKTCISGEKLNFSMAQKLKRDWNCVQPKTRTPANSPHFCARIYHLNAPEIQKPVWRLWTLLSSSGTNFYEIVVSHAIYQQESNAGLPASFAEKNVSRSYILTTQAWITKVTKVPETCEYVSSCNKVWTVIYVVVEYKDED